MKNRKNLEIRVHPSIILVRLANRRLTGRQGADGSVGGQLGAVWSGRAPWTPPPKAGVPGSGLGVAGPRISQISMDFPKISLDFDLDFWIPAGSHFMILAGFALIWVDFNWI